MAGITAAIGKRANPTLLPRRESRRFGAGEKGAPGEDRLWVKEKNIQGIATGNFKTAIWNLGVHILFDWKYVKRVATLSVLTKG